MYISKYWGNFIGGSDDSLNLVAFLEDQKKEEIPLSEIFSKIRLDKQNWDFRQTIEYLEFTHSNGVEMDFHFVWVIRKSLICPSTVRRLFQADKFLLTISTSLSSSRAFGFD